VDKWDKKILHEVQRELPLVSNAFQQIAQKVNLPEQEVLKRIKKLKLKGLIHTFCGRFDYQKLGYTGTLVGMKVSRGKIRDIVKRVSMCEEITHCYLRSHSYNVWFTVVGKSPEEIEAIIEDMKAIAQVEEVLNLPALERFKLKVMFKV
jgi:DNA-binding Lrp family transcriptional regulator